MDQLERLQYENEKLAVDSVALDKIIGVVYAWGMDNRRDPFTSMIKIAKIIEERGDEPLQHDEYAEPMCGATAFAQTFRPKDRRHQQDIRMKPLTR